MMIKVLHDDVLHAPDVSCRLCCQVQCLRDLCAEKTREVRHLLSSQLWCTLHMLVTAMAMPGMAVFKSVLLVVKGGNEVPCHLSLLLRELAPCTGIGGHQHTGECVQNGTTREVVNQLRAISKQQSRIRSLRDSIAGLKAVTTRQAENFAELLLVRRIPAAYRQALAEVARR